MEKEKLTAKVIELGTHRKWKGNPNMNQANKQSGFSKKHIIIASVTVLVVGLALHFFA